MSFFPKNSRNAITPPRGPSGHIKDQLLRWPFTLRARSFFPITGRPDRWCYFATIVLFLAFTPVLSLRAQAATQIGDARAESDIRAIAASFQQAIVDKDDTAFAALFLDPSAATWISVVSDARLAAAEASGRSVGEKVLVGPDRTPLSFILGIVQSPGQHYETMENMRIATDGEIASVHFEFAYLRDGRAITTGEEAWLLVRTEDGWRIVSVVWSKR